MAPILIVKTGTALPAVKTSHGDFEDWFIEGLTQPCRVVNVLAGEPLPRDGYSGVVITGSADMVTERLDWSERTAAWLAEQPDGLPMLGVCYGHQLLAHAFGGRVADNPNGRQIGTIEVSLNEHAEADPLLQQMPNQFDAQASHVQVVVKPPTGATVLATSPRDPNHAIRFRTNVWGLQFHPEWQPVITRGYLQARREPIQAEGQDVDALLSGVRDSHLASGLLAQFAGLAVGSRLADSA